jgi:hypothetical protein
MTLLATLQHILRLLVQSSEPTLKELLSDSAVKAVMEADGVDPLLLEAQLRDMAAELHFAHRLRRNRPQVLP